MCDIIIVNTLALKGKKVKFVMQALVALGMEKLILTVIIAVPQSQLNVTINGSILCV